MGEVWAGRDRQLHRNVAVKLLHHDDHAPPERIRRFEREAVAAAQINHPNIVALYDRGTHDHLQFLIMEYVEGTSLAQYLRGRGPLALDRALEITEEICAALVAAHEANVVHYDVKPSNVMLTTAGSVKVVDFGIAGFTHSHTFTVTPTTMLSPAGTAQYGAPEQFLDERGDERSDLYALGGVLFALLTGAPPFGEGTPLSVIRRKLDEDPPEVTELRPDVPAPVARFLADLLRRDPEERPGSAAAVHRRLAQLRPDTTDRDTHGTETEVIRPLARTRALDASQPGTADVEFAQTVARRWAVSRGVRLLAGLSMSLVVVAIAYYAVVEQRDRSDNAAAGPSATVTSAPRYQRMPDLCGDLQRNQMRGRKELAAYELSKITNDSRNANCGWKGGPDNQGFELVISSVLGGEGPPQEEMKAFTPGPDPFGGSTSSKLANGPGDEAVQTVMDEAISKIGTHNTTYVRFRRANLVIEIKYREFGNLGANHKQRVTTLANQFAGYLDEFLKNEPSNHEKPVWG